jgi:glucose/mannose-6-phosphate isomerase
VDELGAARVAELDAGDMLGAIAGLSRQVDVGYAVALDQLHAAAAGSASVAAGAEALVVSGMGGSAIGADLVLACLPELAVPATVVRGHELPAWAGPQALVIVVSYSGDTAEALACAEAALARGCRPVCVSSGGRLAALAAEHGLPLVGVVAGEQPRAAVGSLSTALLATLVAAGLCDDAAADVADAAAQLGRGAAELGPDVPDGENPAKGLARRLYGRLAVVYGAGLSVPAARRWKGQINENAKAPAFWNELPELDHNELMGWTSLPQVAAETVAVFLEDGDGDPRLLRRAELTAAELDARGVTIERVRARGASRLARLFSLVQLGDYASFYLALLYGVDPTPVAAIQDFKARLAGDAGA